LERDKKKGTRLVNFCLNLDIIHSVQEKSSHHRLSLITQRKGRRDFNEIKNQDISFNKWNKQERKRKKKERRKRKEKKTPPIQG
jgi:hypothetical protein